MKDEDEEAEDEQAEIGDWTLYVSRYYAVFSLPSHIFLWMLNAIYKTRVRVQNANMYMHMS